MTWMRIFQRVGKKVLLAGCLISGCIAYAAKPMPPSQLQAGSVLQFVRTPESGSQQQFLVLRSVKPDGELICSIFGEQRTFSVKRSAVQALPFFEWSSPLTVTQYALYAYAHGKSDGTLLKFARVIGDTSGRMSAIAEFEAARDQFSRKVRDLQKMRREQQLELMDYEDMLSELLIDNPMRPVLQKALSEPDRILAIALLEKYCQTIQDNGSTFSGTQLLRERSSTELTEIRREALEILNRNRPQNTPRQERFRKLCPFARGLWSESPPATYPQLMSQFDRSLNAFVQLDNFSKLTEFPDWGSTMLSVLMMVEGSPAGKELEEEFDQALSDREQSELTSRKKK